MAAPEQLTLETVSGSRKKRKKRVFGLGKASAVAGERGVRTTAQEEALRDAEVGDELVFARRGMDRERFVWLVKKAKR